MGTVLEVRLSLPGSPYPPFSFPNKLGATRRMGHSFLCHRQQTGLSRHNPEFHRITVVANMPGVCGTPESRRRRQPLSRRIGGHSVGLLFKTSTVSSALAILAPSRVVRSLEGFTRTNLQNLSRSSGVSK